VPNCTARSGRESCVAVGSVVSLRGGMVATIAGERVGRLVI
jgi:hypothetical protein